MSQRNGATFPSTRQHSSQKNILLHLQNNHCSFREEKANSLPNNVQKIRQLHGEMEHRALRINPSMSPSVKEPSRGDRVDSPDNAVPTSVQLQRPFGPTSQLKRGRSRMQKTTRSLPVETPSKSEHRFQSYGLSKKLTRRERNSTNPARAQG